MAYISELDAGARIIRARHALVTSETTGFWGALALGQKLVERADVETAAVDGKHLFYAPEFIRAQTEPELIGLLAHEVSHLALCHHTRRGRRDPELWNVAADYAINAGLVAAGFTLPQGALLDSRFDGANAESIYATLAAEKAQQAQQAPAPDQSQSEPGGAGAGEPSEQAQGEPGAPDAGQAPARNGDASEGAGTGPGSGAPQQAAQQAQQAAPDPGRCGGVMDAAPDGASMADAEAEMESRVRQAIAVAAAQAGDMPGGLARILGELNRPRVDWRAALQRFIDDAAQKRLDWTRPNKRFLDSPYIMPGMTGDFVARLAVAIDTSGSISDAILAALASEVQGMLDSGRVESVFVCYCDFEGSRVRRVQLRRHCETR